MNDHAMIMMVYVSFTPNHREFKNEVLYIPCFISLSYDLRQSLGAGHRSSNVEGNSSNTSGAIIPSSPCDHKERVSNLTHTFEVIQEVSSTNHGISENMHDYMLVEP